MGPFWGIRVGNRCLTLSTVRGAQLILQAPQLLTWLLSRHRLMGLPAPWVLAEMPSRPGFTEPLAGHGTTLYIWDGWTDGRMDG